MATSLVLDHEITASSFPSIQGSVAKSTHAGIPWLRYLRQQLGGRVHFWPFDGWAIPPGKWAIAEARAPPCGNTLAPRNAAPPTNTKLTQSPRGCAKQTTMTAPSVAQSRDLVAVIQWLELDKQELERIDSTRRQFRFAT